MISKEINQNLNKKYNPEGSELRKLQHRMLEMLEYFDSFCKENNVKYWLSSGSCLGAIRHGGFIPWDDDMDIEMLREDYEKFIALRKEFNNDNFVIQDYNSDREYITPFAKIRDLRSEIKEVHNRDNYFKYKGVFIDVFIREKGSFWTMRVSHIAQYLSYQLTNIRCKPIRRFTKSFLYLIMQKLLFPILTSFNKMFIHNTTLCFGLGYGFYKQIESAGLFPLKKVEFEGRQFPVPGNYDDYLHRLYGDYMKLPERTEDFKKHFKSIIIN